MAIDFAVEAETRWQGVLNEVFGPGAFTIIDVDATVDRMGAVVIGLWATDTRNGKATRFLPFYDQAGMDAAMVEDNPSAYATMIAGATEAENFDWQEEELN